MLVSLSHASGFQRVRIDCELGAPAAGAPTAGAAPHFTAVYGKEHISRWHEIIAY